MCSYDHQQRRSRSMARKDKRGKVRESHLARVDYCHRTNAGREKRPARKNVRREMTCLTSRQTTSLEDRKRHCGYRSTHENNNKTKADTQTLKRRTHHGDQAERVFCLFLMMNDSVIPSAIQAERRKTKRV